MLKNLEFDKKIEKVLQEFITLTKFKKFFLLPFYKGSR